MRAGLLGLAGLLVTQSGCSPAPPPPARLPSPSPSAVADPVAARLAQGAWRVSVGGVDYTYRFHPDGGYELTDAGGVVHESFTGHWGISRARKDVRLVMDGATRIVVSPSIISWQGDSLVVDPPSTPAFDHPTVERPAIVLSPVP